MKKLIQGYKEFITQGNALDLAIGVVVGAAFGAVITALTERFINPIVGAILGAQDLTRVWDITLRRDEFGAPMAQIEAGYVFDAVFKFLLTMAVIYFIIIIPINRLRARRKTGEEAEPEAPAADIVLLQEIRDLLAKGNTSGATAAATPPSDS